VDVDAEDVFVEKRGLAAVFLERESVLRLALGFCLMD
jgi:hypothetical protein